MNEDQKAKIVRFLNDQAMSEAVFGVLLKAFLKATKDRDVQNLAATMIAVERLDEAWKELTKFKSEQKGEQEEKAQRGL